MKAIDRKIVRNLWGMKGQAFAIALVIASGVATFIMSVSTMQSLKLTQEEIPGVERVETRVVAGVNIEIRDFPDPVTGHIYSIPDHGEPILNKLFLRQGRLVEPLRDDEAVVGEAFAQAHGFVPGDTVSVIVNGRRKTLNIVGIAFACAIMMVGSFQEDSVDFMVDIQFGMSQREDLAVTFVEPASRRALQ